MRLDAGLRFRLATLTTILSALLAGYFHVGSLYLFGLPIVPLAISLLVLWTTKVSILKKVVATLIGLFFILAGFFVWVWWNEITLIRKW
jgi:hypothetical protein